MAIAEVIKFEGDPNQLVWKHPAEDFNTTSQLIVDETHEALLVINGNAADLFGPGRRTLSTSNIPILRSIIEIPTGGVSAFPCKVFFINKVHQMDMKWGTQSAIPLEDPLYDIFMHVMLHGSMSVSLQQAYHACTGQHGTAGRPPRTYPGCYAQHSRQVGEHPAQSPADHAPAV